MPKYKVEFDGLVQSKQTNIILVGNERGKKKTTTTTKKKPICSVVYSR